MIGTFFKAKITRLKPRKTYYRNYKNFDKSSFLLDLKSTNLDSSSVDPDENYIFLTNQFLKVVNQHAPLKVKFLRGNHASFVDKQLRKEIYKRSKLKNKYCINPSEQNAALYKKQRNKCASLRRRCIKDYFTKITKNGIVTNKNFRKTMKSFLINKGKLGNPEFMLQDKGNIVSDESVLVKTFTEHYINIVEKLCGKNLKYFIRIWRYE